MENVIPEIVEGNNGKKSIGYSGLIPVLVKAIKEQQNQIEDLEAEVGRLKAELRALQ